MKSKATKVRISKKWLLAKIIPIGSKNPQRSTLVSSSYKIGDMRYDVIWCAGYYGIPFQVKVSCVLVNLRQCVNTGLNENHSGSGSRSNFGLDTSFENILLNIELKKIFTFFKDRFLFLIYLQPLGQILTHYPPPHSHPSSRPPMFHVLNQGNWWKKPIKQHLITRLDQIHVSHQT